LVKLLGKPRQIDSRNRVILPPEVMKLLNLKPNDEVFFRVNEGKIIVGKALIKYEFINEIVAILESDNFYNSKEPLATVVALHFYSVLHFYYRSCTFILKQQEKKRFD